MEELEDDDLVELIKSSRRDGEAGNGDETSVITFLEESQEVESVVVDEFFESTDSKRFVAQPVVLTSEQRRASESGFKVQPSFSGPRFNDIKRNTQDADSDNDGPSEITMNNDNNSLTGGAAEDVDEPLLSYERPSQFPPNNFTRFSTANVRLEPLNVMAMSGSGLYSHKPPPAQQHMSGGSAASGGRKVSKRGGGSSSNGAAPSAPQSSRAQLFTRDRKAPITFESIVSHPSVGKTAVMTMQEVEDIQ